MENKSGKSEQSFTPMNAADGKTGLSWIKKLIRDSKKPKGFSVVSAKRALLLLAGQGKEPAALKVAPDGSFCIDLVQAAKDPPNSDENPWDEVL